MLKRLVVPALSLALLASSAHAEAPLRAEQQLANSKRADAQLKGLSITPLGKVAVWRDRSLRTPQTVADLKIVKRYLNAKQKLRWQHLEIQLDSGMSLSLRGTVKHAYFLQPMKTYGLDISAAKVVKDIHQTAEAIRSGNDGDLVIEKAFDWYRR